MSADTREPVLRPHWPRYEARSKKTGRTTVWGVYDTQMAAWPAIRDGERWPQDRKDQAEVEAFVEARNAEEPQPEVKQSRKAKARAKTIEGN